MKHILWCYSCKQYTMQESCPQCGEQTSSLKPAKFSIHDPNGRARRIAKKEQLSTIE